jgi:hypothetical protein
MEEIIKEFNKKFPVEESCDFSSCKVRREFTFTGNINSWLKEKLSAFEKTTKEEFLKSEIQYWIDVFDKCPKDRDLVSDEVAKNFARIEIERHEKLLNAEKDGVTLIK